MIIELNYSIWVNSEPAGYYKHSMLVDIEDFLALEDNNILRLKHSKVSYILDKESVLKLKEFLVANNRTEENLNK